LTDKKEKLEVEIKEIKLISSGIVVAYFFSFVRPLFDDISRSELSLIDGENKHKINEENTKLELVIPKQLNKSSFDEAASFHKTSAREGAIVNNEEKVLYKKVNYKIMDGNTIIFFDVPSILNSALKYYKTPMYETNEIQIQDLLIREMDNFSKEITRMIKSAELEEKLSLNKFNMTDFKLFVLGFIVGIILASIISTLLIKKNKLRLYVDKLTGFKNTNFLDDHFKDYLLPNISFILIDVDDFKKYNTNFGYDIADEILKEFAERMKQTMNPFTEIARYKFGDEFLIISKSKSIEESLSLLNNLKSSLKNQPIQTGNTVHNLEFSAGLTTLKKGDSQDKVMSRLIDSLDIAKKSKNSIEVAK
jgi:diguanylate cyclase (GGDEF)-like protein